MNFTHDKHDLRWMRRALRLAGRGEGATRPNPPVGAVIVKAGRLLGEGWHACAGEPHAEVVALRTCREDPRGAILYVTLEPCCTHGRTPPCTDRIVKAGLARVVVGCSDPDPRHLCRGLDQLRRAGIEVVEGLCQKEAEDLIRPFATRIVTGTPYVTLKLAMTLDGRIADRSGASQWITGPTARRDVQRLRRRADAVLVGAGTVCADDPSLLCRLPGAGSRLRVVVDARGRVPPEARVLTDEAAGFTVLATTSAAPPARRRAWATRGARVWTFRPTKVGRVPLRALLRRLAREGVMHLLCEGGGALAGSLLRERHVDACRFYYAPVVMGDDRAHGGVAGADFLLDAMPRFKIVETRLMDGDLMVHAQRTWPRPAGESD